MHVAKTMLPLLGIIIILIIIIQFFYQNLRIN